MTRRRDLEQAVIKAARPLRHLNRALSDAIFDLDKLREVEKPRANRVAPITSHQAAAWTGAHTQKPIIGLIFNLIYWVNVKHGDGVTADEVTLRLGLTHQTASARVNELANAGWIVDSGKVRKTRSGREAIVWIPSPAARQAVDGAPAGFGR